MATFYLYKLVGSGNVPFWVGVTNNPTKRKQRHKETARNERYKHHDPAFRALLLSPDLRIVVIETYATREAALDAEKFAVKAIGRRDLSTGPLFNITDGGPGSSNPSGSYRQAIGNRKWTPEQRARQSAAITARNKTPESRAKNSAGNRAYFAAHPELQHPRTGRLRCPT